MIEHVENPRAWVHELARVTRRSGIVSIVTDTYMWKWLKRLGLYRPVQPIDEAIHPRHIIGWAQQAGLRLRSCGGFVNTPGQRLYLLRTLLRSIPGLRRIVRWFRRSPAPPPPPQGSDDAEGILSALEEFSRLLRPGRRSCVWSYECFYWFEKP